MLTDDGYRQLMKHAKRLAQEGHGELAQHLRDAIDLRAEVERLTEVVKAANTQAEHFERQWYLRGDEVEALRAENHNLNWALGTPGYNAMATHEEQAEHEAAVARTDAILARMAKAKSEHAAMTADADRYRFIDEHCGVVDMISDPDNLVQVWVAEKRYYGSTLEEAIDAAMKGSES